MQVDIIVETAYSEWYLRVYVYVTRHQDLLILAVTIPDIELEGCTS